MENKKIKLIPAIGIFFLYWGLYIAVPLLALILEASKQAGKANVPILEWINNNITSLSSLNWYYIILLALSFALILWLSKRQGMTFFSFKPISGKDLGFTALMFFAIWGSSIFWTIVATIFSLSFETTANQEALNEMMEQVPFILFFLYTVILAPVLEEVMIRGFIMKYFFPHKKIIGLIVSTIVFASLHGPTDILSFCIYASMGAILGAIYFVTGRIELSILAHFTNNFIAVMLQYLL